MQWDSGRKLLCKTLNLYILIFFILVGHSVWHSLLLVNPFGCIDSCCSVAKLCLILCDLTDCSTPGFPVLHYPLEFDQIHVHWVGDAIQPSDLLQWQKLKEPLTQRFRGRCRDGATFRYHRMQGCIDGVPSSLHFQLDSPPLAVIVAKVPGLPVCEGLNDQQQPKPHNLLPFCSSRKGLVSVSSRRTLPSLGPPAGTQGPWEQFSSL